MQDLLRGEIFAGNYFILTRKNLIAGNYYVRGIIRIPMFQMPGKGGRGREQGEGSGGTGLNVGVYRTCSLKKTGSDASVPFVQM